MNAGVIFIVFVTIQIGEAWCCLDHQENCSVYTLESVCNDTTGCRRCGGVEVDDIVVRERGIPFGVLLQTQRIFVPRYVIPFPGKGNLVAARRRLLFWDFFESVLPNFITSIPTMIWDGITGMLPKVNIVGRDSLKNQTQELIDLTRQVADGAAENALLINETNRLRTEGDRLLAEAIQAHEEELEAISRDVLPRVALLIRTQEDEQSEIRMREQEARFNEYVVNQQNILRVMGASPFVHKLNEISSLFQLQGLEFPAEVVTRTFFVSSHMYYIHQDTTGHWQSTSMFAEIKVTRRSTYLSLLVAGNQEIYDWTVKPIGVGHMPFCLDCPINENRVAVSVEECYRRLVIACRNSRKSCFVNTNGGPTVGGVYINTTGYSTPFVVDVGRNSRHCNYPECNGIEGSGLGCAAPATSFSPSNRVSNGTEYWSLHEGVGSSTSYASDERGWPGVGRLSTVWLPSATSSVYGLSDLSSGNRPPPLFRNGGFEQGPTNITRNFSDPGTNDLWSGPEDYYPFGTEFLDPISIGRSLMPPPTLGPWNLTGHLRDLFESGGRSNNLRLAEYGPFEEIEVARIGNRAVVANESLFLDSEEILAFFRGSGHLYGWLPTSNCRREPSSQGDRMRCYTESGNDLVSGAIEVSQVLAQLETVHSPDLTRKIDGLYFNLSALEEAREMSRNATADLREGIVVLEEETTALEERATANADALAEVSAELSALAEKVALDPGRYEVRVSWAERNALPLALAILMGILLIAGAIWCLVRAKPRMAAIAL